MELLKKVEFSVGDILPPTCSLRKSLKYSDGIINGTIVSVEYESKPGAKRNVYLLDANRKIVWQIEEPEVNPKMNMKGDAYTYIWFEGETLVARTEYGNEYSIDLKTGKRIKWLRFNR